MLIAAIGLVVRALGGPSTYLRFALLPRCGGRSALFGK